MQRSLTQSFHSSDLAFIHFPPRPNTADAEVQTTMPAPGPYNSKHLPPIPGTTPPYGGSEQAPVYFWNASLPADDIVCAVDFKNVTDSCCPFAFGIRDDGTPGCRMGNATERIAWFTNCTKQTWGEVTGRPQDAVVTCVPMASKIESQTAYAQEATPPPPDGKLHCTTVGDPGALGPKLDFTGQCCAKLGGEVSGAGSSDRAAGAGSYTAQCTVDADLGAKWNECIQALHTYPFCKGEGQGGDAKSGALRPALGAGAGILVAAAALAALA